VFGVKGWVKVFSYTDPREAILDYDGWLLGGNSEWRPVNVAEGQRHGKTVVVRIDGYDDRDQAATLIGSEIGVERNGLPPTEEGHYYWSDIEGLEVRRKDGSVLGKLSHLLETGAHDVMVIEGETERLVPFVKDEVVVDVDLAAGVIIVDWEWD